MNTRHTLAAAVAAALTLSACGPGEGLNDEEFDQITAALATNCGSVAVTERVDCYRSTLDTLKPQWQLSADNDVFVWLLRQDQHISELVKTGRMQAQKATRFARRADSIALGIEATRIAARDAAAADTCHYRGCTSRLGPYLPEWQLEDHARRMLAFSKRLNAAASPAPEAQRE